MTDNLGPLRQAMSDLSEHGGSTDMYERSLRKSRQSQRRIALTTGAATAAVVFAIGGAAAFAAANRPNPSTPVAIQPPTPGVASTSAAPTTRPPSSRSPSSTRTDNGPQYLDCPSTKSLEKLVELPKGWSFVPSGVECVKDWAAAKLKRPTPGDSVYLFHYTTGAGWRYHDQGSGWDCKDLGLDEPAPFCTS